MNPGAGLADPGHLEDRRLIDFERVRDVLEDRDLRELGVAALDHGHAGPAQANDVTKLALRQTLRLAGIPDEIAELDAAF